MKSELGSKALVTVVEDAETARKVIEKLVASGVSRERIELVTRDVHRQASEVETPKVGETAASTIVKNASKWVGVGLGTGAIAGLLTPFPGLALGMIAMGGLTGAIVGGMAGIDEAVEDESVDLPTVDEYQELVSSGNLLIVLRGDHDEVMEAEAIVKHVADIRSHLHPLHGHDFHEHTVREE
ncbi:MAG: hypothetical protein R3C03_22840 [Pirellulaceae bacterium]